jgi:RNA-splicing ligase RtcB
LRLLREGAEGADLAAPAVALPDFHLKADKEMPSSIAVATRETIRPTFTCCSLNCGMALVALDVERPGRDAITDFYSRVRARLPFPPTYRRDLTVDEVIRAATEGAFLAVDKYGVNAALTERIEHGGRLDVEAYGGAERIRRELPWTVKQLSRIRFATIGKSNHFIDLQQVEEIFDPETAALLGVEQGQVTMQYHGGGGALPGELGVLFGRRKRFPRGLRMQMAVQKPLYHLASARSLAPMSAA